MQSFRVLGVLAFALLLVTADQARAQGAVGTINGRVVDSTSQAPIASASVTIVGTTRGTLTRPDGSFALSNVPAGSATVRVSRIGYAAVNKTTIVIAGGAITLNYQLKPIAAFLSEIVTTGYGSQRREQITGSVATVKGDDADVGVMPNVNGMLAGRVPGITVTQQTGEPGAGSEVRIRGGTSISGSNDPLYVVDGVPLQNENISAGAYGVADINPALPRSSLNSINPNDIESITVLKDASATAIYGSRGANGVVLIQTKRGSSTRAAIDYDTYFAASTPSRGTAGKNS